MLFIPVKYTVSKK